MNQETAEVSGTEEEILNLNSASRLAGVGASAIRYWILTGLLPAEKISGSWRIKMQDVLIANEKNAENPRRGKRGRRGTLVRST